MTLQRPFGETIVGKTVDGSPYKPPKKNASEQDALSDEDLNEHGVTSLVLPAWEGYTQHENR